jgi:hypothetical protein
LLLNRLFLGNVGQDQISHIREETENDDDSKQDEVDEPENFFTGDEFKSGKTADSEYCIKFDRFEKIDDADVESKAEDGVDEQECVQGNGQKPEELAQRIV